MHDPWPPRDPPALPPPTPTIFEQIADVMAASDHVTHLREQIKDHPRDHSLHTALQDAERDLAAAAKGTRAQLRLINCKELP